MKFKLKAAHFFPGDVYLEGEKEVDDKAVVVGDGTPYPVVALSKAKPGEMTPTVLMEPLDDEAREALEEEEERLSKATASMVPLEQLARTMEAAFISDDHERRSIPGFGPRK